MKREKKKAIIARKNFDFRAVWTTISSVCLHLLAIFVISIVVTMENSVFNNPETNFASHPYTLLKEEYLVKSNQVRTTM
jgi:hypothetical protein